MVAISRPETLRIDRNIANQTTEPPVRPRRPLRRTALALMLLAGTAAAGYYGYDYWENGRFQVSTDDAYVKADYTTIAPKVAGYIAQVLVEDNQWVKGGQILAAVLNATASRSGL